MRRGIYTIHQRLSYWIHLTLGVCAAFGWQPLAHAEGLNQENYYPGVDAQSALMFETAQTLPSGSFLWGVTSSWAWHPVELGDGKGKRLSLSDNLWVVSYVWAVAITSYLELGSVVPMAVYSAPHSPEGYLGQASDRSRSVFFLVDPRLRAKFNFTPNPKAKFHMGLIGTLQLPMGNQEALLSDGTSRFLLELPLEREIWEGQDDSLSLWFTPGISRWGDANRLTQKQADGSTATVVSKDKSLLLGAGLRYWWGHFTQLEWAIRGDFNNHNPSFNQRLSPIEWAVGLAGYAWGYSTHIGWGTGVGSGVGAPASRFVVGIRSKDTPEPPKDTPPTPPLPSSTPQPQVPVVVVTPSLVPPLVDEPDPLAEVAPPPQQDEDTLVVVTATGVLELGPILFEFDRATLTEQSKGVIAKLHEILKGQNATRVTIEGHTDSVGSLGYNVRLSQKRADAVRTELARQGFPGARVKAYGFGFKFPLVSNATPQGRIRNRRIEVGVDGLTNRRAFYTSEERALMQEWIFPGGRQPRGEFDDLTRPDGGKPAPGPAPTPAPQDLPKP